MDLNVSKLSRAELEDKLYRSHEEIIELKKIGNSQTEKMKQLATKILRLKSDMKKIQAGKPTKYTHENDLIDELKLKLINSEHENNALKQKIQILKVGGPVKNISGPSRNNLKTYKFVEPRVDTGLHQKHIMYTPIKKGTKIPDKLKVKSATREIGELEEKLEYLYDRVQELEEENRNLDLSRQEVEVTYENKLLMLQEQMCMQQKNDMDEDIQLINLQRKIKERDEKIVDLEAKLLTALNKSERGKTHYDKSSDECQKLRLEIERLQSKVSLLGSKPEDEQASRILELTMQLHEAQAERDILKEENQRLLDGVFNTAKERKYRDNEKKLRERIRQLEFRLENTQVPEVENQGEMFDKYLAERNRANDLEHDVNKLNLKNKELTCLTVQLQEQIERTEKELVQIREINTGIQISATSARVNDLTAAQGTAEPIKPLIDPNNVTCKEQVEKELSELQVEYANLVTELDKTNNLLDVQYRLNKVYQDENNALKSKYDSIRKEYEKQENENAKLLDVRAHKINKLERQLRDVAYGTKPVRFEAITDKDESRVYLEKGQNILRVHLGKIFLTSDALVDIQDQIFIVINFYHFESVISKLVCPVNSDFNTTTKFIVNTDQNFLNCLKYDSARFLLYTCSGSNFRCIAGGKVSFKELITENGNNAIHSSVQLLGVSGDLTGVSVAALDYDYSLLYPIAHALSLYREREKAGLYLEANSSKIDGDDTVSRDNCDNELKITIASCSNLKQRGDIQPCPYVVYKFYTFGDHDTQIIPNSNDPQFNDIKVYPVSVTQSLHTYLCHEMLRVYVFNDSDLDYLMGYCDVPLLHLAHDLIIEGDYDIRDSSEKFKGTLRISLEWNMTYCAPKAGTLLIPSSKRAESIKSEIEVSPQPLRVPASLPRESAPLVTRKTEPVLNKPPPPPATMNEPQNGESRKTASIPETNVNERIIDHGGVDIDKPRTEFLSFRSADEYHKALEAQNRKKGIESGDLDSVPVSERSGAKKLSDEPKSPEEEYEDDSDDVVLGTFTPSPSPDARNRVENFRDDPLSDDQPKKLENTFFEEEDDEVSDDIIAPPEKDFAANLKSIPVKDLAEDFDDEDTEYKAASFDDTDDDMVVIPKSSEAHSTTKDSWASDSDNDYTRTDEDYSRSAAPVAESKTRNTLDEALDSSVATNAPPIVVVVHYVKFNRTAPFLQDKRSPLNVFVEYKLLTFDPADTETPQSLMVVADTKLNFNFRKTFLVNSASPIQMKLLRDALNYDNKITFTVVSDPGQASDVECQNLCSAEVDFPFEYDILEKEVPLYVGEIKVGVLNVTIETTATLEALQLAY